MNIVEKIKTISNIDVDTRIEEQSKISEVLFYSLYYLFKEFPELFSRKDDVYDDICLLIKSNLYDIQNGGDQVMTFYYINKYNFKKDSNFKEMYELYLDSLSTIKTIKQEYKNLNAYIMLNEKINEFEVNNE